MDGSGYNKPKLALSRPGQEPRESLSKWYLPNEHEIRETNESILKTTYDRAIIFHKELYQSSDQPSFLDKTSSMQDVLNILSQAQTKYHHQKTNKIGWKQVAAPVVSWWKVASTRMMQYEKVIDTLVSANPEYAALVWGSMKFLFMVTLNNEGLSNQIARAFAEIGSVLPEAEFLAHSLYPLASIQTTLARVYTELVEFCIRATSWYDKVRKNLLTKTIHSILKTWPLEFEDVKLNIDMQIRRLREQAAIAHQAETREMHRKLGDIFDWLKNQQLDKVQMIFGQDAPTLSPNPSMISQIPFILHNALPYLETSGFKPQERLEFAITMKKRRQARQYSPASVWASIPLHEWTSGQESTALLLQASQRRSGGCRDFIVDMIEVLQLAGFPVIWYLSCSPDPAGAASAPTNLTDIFKTLIHQLFDVYQHSSASWTLNEGHFRACQSADDWLRLLAATIGQVPRIMLIIDANEDNSVLRDGINQLWEEIKEQKIDTIIKIILLTAQRPSGSLAGYPFLPASYLDSQGSRQSRVVTRIGGTRQATIQGRNIGRYGGNASLARMSGMEDYKRYVMSLTAQTENKAPISGDSINVTPIP